MFARRCWKFSCEFFNKKKLVICNYLFILTLGNSNAMEVWYGYKEKGQEKDHCKEASSKEEDNGEAQEGCTEEKDHS